MMEGLLKEKLGEAKEWLTRKAIIEKFNNIPGYIFLVFIALSFAFVVSKGGILPGAILLCLIVGVPVIFTCLFRLEIGVFIVLIVSFFILTVLRFVDAPLGLTMDALIFLMFFGLFIKQTRERDWSFAQNPISYVILIWIFYNLIQVLNPGAASRLAWFYTIRSMAGIMVLFFIALYSFKTVDQVGLFFKIWLFLAFLAGAYGIFQEVHGLMQFELDWIMADELRYNLYYNWGRFRKFSFLNDPTTFGIVMGFSGLACFALLAGPFSDFKKILLTIAGSTMLISMVYSGTRTAYALVPVGFMFFTLLTFKRNILIISGIVFFLGTAVIVSPIKSLGPLGSNSLTRIRSTFQFEEDPSYNVRAVNQKNIQPYIQTHPLGGGLGSVGVWGQRFSPNSPLSEFKPDSGYMRVAVEMGWIGLIINLSIFFTILRVGIKNYYSVKDPKIKAYLGMILTVVYSLIVANFPQQAITIYPTIVIFYVLIALLVKLKEFDGALKVG
jgi:putative inorganic carbon (HCO3(-)) transporter